MKIYLYCPETGIYQGEDFADDCSMKKERTGIAPGCTTIAPPEYARGQVPVFNFIQKRWKVYAIAAAAQQGCRRGIGVVGTASAAEEGG